MFNLFENFCSSTAADLSESLVAISIEDSDSNTKNVSDEVSDEPEKGEQLLPVKMCYEWKDITPEFFEAVKGNN